MSLMRLLTMSRSLAVGAVESTRYNFSRRNALPTFGAASCGDSLAPVGKPALVLGTIFHAVAPQIGVAAMDASATPRTEVQCFSQVSAQVPAVDRGRHRARLAKGACRMVQTELSLKAVKVVRNDLSDADLEVVPTSGTEAPSPRHADQWGRNGSAPTSGGGVGSLGVVRLLTRWLNLGKGRA